MGLIDWFVPPGARVDAARASRYRGVIKSLLAISVTVMVLLLFYLLVRSAPTKSELGLFSTCIVIPVLGALLVRGSGRILLPGSVPLEEFNERFGTDTWTPIVFDVRDDHARSMVALEEADVVLVNSVRDGLNLVAMETAVMNTRDTIIVCSRETGAFVVLEDGVIGTEAQAEGSPAGIGRKTQLSGGERTMLSGGEDFLMLTDCGYFQDRFGKWDRQAGQVMKMTTSGKLLRSADFTEVKNFGHGLLRPAHVVMHNEIAKERKSELEWTAVDVAAEVSDAKFGLSDLGH